METEGAMYAIMKMTPEEIEKICEQTEGYVVPVNYNSPAQTVIAGEKAAAEKAAAEKAAGASGVAVRPVKNASKYSMTCRQRL